MPDEAAARTALGTVCDPEIPVLSIADLGIVREVKVEGDAVEVALTPTYSGCPATHVIEMEAELALRRAGFGEVRLSTRLSPAWTTDWISEDGRRKLREIGIVPPAHSSSSKRALMGIEDRVDCPLCGSARTRMLSAFGSTACKAIWRCDSCLETFDQFKCI